MQLEADDMHNKGQALIVVVSLLAMLFIVGIAFYVLSQAERTAILRHLDALKSRYITEAGVVYAQKVLNIERETNLIDSLEDLTFTHFQGQDTDLDGDGKAESRWFDVTDSQGNLFGRFSVWVEDEASKLHLNVSQRQTLEQLFSQLGIDSSKADALLCKCPFDAIEQVCPLLTKEEFNLTKNFLTVYSREPEVDSERKTRAYINSPSAQVILEAFLSAGIKDAYQKAANLKDAADSDLIQTTLDEFSLSGILPSGLIESGSWQKVGNYYEAPAAGIAGKFAWSNLPLEDGEYFCFLYGPSDTSVIGNVYLDDEKAAEPLYSGEGLKKKVKVVAGGLTLNIRPAKDLKQSRFSHIELASLNSRNGLNRKIISGTEALVINELMVKPGRQILIGAVNILPGESFQYVFTGIKPTNYYLIVKAGSTGGLVGDVYINGHKGGNLYDGDYFPYSVNVAQEGSLSLKITNETLGKTSFKGIEIFQEPDAEFIELLNLSSQEIDLSNSSFEVYSPTGELIPGWPAHIPEGIAIKPYQHLVFAVDANDASPSPSKITNNNISFQKIWEFSAVGLVFEEYLDSIDKSFDLLPNEGAKVILKDASGEIIDAVEYGSSQVSDFVSLERPDPTAKTDADNDGLFDGWYLSDSGDRATPGLANDNPAMYTQDPATDKLIKHSPSEIKIFNRKISDLSGVRQLSNGRNWEKFAFLDLARMSDHFAYEALALALSGHYKSGEFKEVDGVFESLHKEGAGVWEFRELALGSYLLNIISADQNFSTGFIQVAIKTDDQQDFQNFSLLLFNQGAAFYGAVELSKEPSILELKIINDFEARLRLKEIQLEPVSFTRGRININTAKPEVLLSVFNSDKLVQEILKNRPLGAKDNRRLGVGELFLLDADFLSFHKALTVKSDVYKIVCKGEYNPASKIPISQTIHSVVERGK
jgi:hypothetical protein